MLFLPALYPIVNSISAEQTKRELEALLGNGALLVQLRAKDIQESELKEIILSSLNLRNRLAPNCKILVNDYYELAAETGADGVHLGRTDAGSESGPFSRLEAARELLGKQKIIGLSNHSVQQIQEAPVELLDYLALGPIFKSNTKSGHAQEVGLENLKTAKAYSKLPLVAIGGITRDRIKATLNAGATSCAMIETFKVENLKTLFEEFSASRKKN